MKKAYIALALMILCIIGLNVFGEMNDKGYITEILTAWILATLTYPVLVFVHEIGHKNAIIKTSKEIGYDVKEISLHFKNCFLQGITNSDFYAYISEHRDKKDIQEVIKRNAIAGIEAEKKCGLAMFIGIVIFTVWMAVTSGIMYGLVNLVITSTISGLGYWLAYKQREGSSDMCIYENPQAFEYKKAS